MSTKFTPVPKVLFVAQLDCQSQWLSWVLWSFRPEGWIAVINEMGWRFAGFAFCRLGLVFFFRRFGRFFFFIRLLALSTISIYFSNTDRQLERSLRFGLNGFIKHFVLGVNFLVATIYLSLDRWLWAFLETPNQYLLVRGRDGVKILKHGLEMLQMGHPV